MCALSALPVWRASWTRPGGPLTGCSCRPCRVSSSSGGGYPGLAASQEAMQRWIVTAYWAAWCLGSSFGRSPRGFQRMMGRRGGEGGRELGRSWLLGSHAREGVATWEARGWGASSTFGRVSSASSCAAMIPADHLGSLGGAPSNALWECWSFG